eukprot:2145591-Rhodomonas_salina.2
MLDGRWAREGDPRGAETRQPRRRHCYEPRLGLGHTQRVAQPLEPLSVHESSALDRQRLVGLTRGIRAPALGVGPLLLVAQLALSQSRRKVRTRHALHLALRHWQRAALRALQLPVPQVVGNPTLELAGAACLGSVRAAHTSVLRTALPDARSDAVTPTGSRWKLAGLTASSSAWRVRDSER